jgi:hypothetical protein
MLLDLPTRAIVALAHHNQQEALKRFTLFNGDVEGTCLAFRAFDNLKATRMPTNNIALMYHASCFVCAVRRAGRLLKALSANPPCFRKPVAEVVRLQWRMKRAFFQSFVDARNAIEHIDGEARDVTKWAFFNLKDDEFHVVNGVFVYINDESREKCVSSRDAIAEAIIHEYNDPMFDFLDSVTST